ncbi:MAG TPA: GreA/GreB family elongation factor [Rhodothermales bacterium]|nr:GreA/GreB family elongation factor [Rhodothermales bacterium]
MESMTRNIYITDHDASRLMRLLTSGQQLNTPANRHLLTLKEELEAATTVAPQAIPPFVITMNSRFRLKDLETAHEAEYTLVFPGKADINQGKISILAPAGAAFIGAKELETVSVQTPVGLKRFRVESITYQPEMEEEYEL